jgi:hypothetical protein
MYQDRLSLYQDIEAFTESKVICYVTGDRKNMEVQIGDDVVEHFAEHLDNIGKPKKITLVIYSRGGNTLTGWSLVNLVRQFCKEFDVIIPSKAHSTATLIALGANSIMMTKQATLGPIDPSVNGPLNPQSPGNNPLARIPISVESINAYFEYVKSLGIKNKGGLDKIVVDLASRIHPVVLGNVYRSRTQIQMLGRKLLSKHLRDGERIEKILSFLCSESGSHDYTIYRDEARDELGLKINTPNDDEYLTIKKLHNDYVKELKLLTPFDPNVELGTENACDYSIVRGIVESVKGGSTKFISEGVLSRTQIPGPLPNQHQEGVQDRRSFEGWKNDK